MFLPRFHHHGSPFLQRFPTVFTRNFRTAPRLWLPRSSVNTTTKASETPRFRDELARSTFPKSFNDHLRHPGIRNQILVSRIWGSVPRVSSVLNELLRSFFSLALSLHFQQPQSVPTTTRVIGPRNFRSGRASGLWVRLVQTR